MITLVLVGEPVKDDRQPVERGDPEEAPHQELQAARPAGVAGEGALQLDGAIEGGWDLARFNETGERIWNLERQFNLAAGLTADVVGMGMAVIIGRMLFS